MDNKERPEHPTIADQLRDLPPPAWIEEMRRQGYESGSYNPDDLYRLLGNPSEGVTVGLSAKIPQSFYGIDQQQ